MVLDVPLEEILAQSGSGSRLSGEVKSLLDPTEVTSMPGKVTSLLPPPIPDQAKSLAPFLLTFHNRMISAKKLFFLQTHNLGWGLSFLLVSWNP